MDHNMKLRSITIIAIAALTALVGGFWPFSQEQLIFQSAASAEQHELYRCPMHPEFTSDKPGDCPICGMHLVKVEQEKNGEIQASRHDHELMAPALDHVPVKFSAEQQALMGIVTEKASVMPLERTIQTTAKVSYDETKLHHIHTKFDAYIVGLYANFVGQAVKQGDALFSVYSPELWATENEYLLALKGKGGGATRDEKNAALGGQLVSAAKQRLALWDVGAEEMVRLEKEGKASTSILIRSPINGVVTATMARQGMRITPVDTVYDVADLSSVWLLADIYEMDLPFVHPGQIAEVELVAQPGKLRSSKIAFIDPILDAKTRTVKARLELDNSDGDLKPEMYAKVRILSNLGSGLVVPESAVIWTGARRIAFVESSQGVFEPREVVTGVKAGGNYEIKQGLIAGEKVALGANFLLDSESKLRANMVAMVSAHKH